MMSNEVKCAKLQLKLFRLFKKKKYLQILIQPYMKVFVFNY